MEYKFCPGIFKFYRDLSYTVDEKTHSLTNPNLPASNK